MALNGFSNQNKIRCNSTVIVVLRYFTWFCGIQIKPENLLCKKITAIAALLIHNYKEMKKSKMAEAPGVITIFVKIYRSIDFLWLLHLPNQYRPTLKTSKICSSTSSIGTQILAIYNEYTRFTTTSAKTLAGCGMPKTLNNVYKLKINWQRTNEPNPR